ncbi:hypothetical protein LguiA_034542 [Lonicera macranthoides]
MFTKLQLRAFIFFIFSIASSLGESSPSCSSCAACTYKRKRCQPWCEYAQIFREVISRQDYRTIFTVFGVKNVADILQNIPQYQHLETLNSFLFEAKARIENPIKGCTALLASLEHKVEELQERVTALEARSEGGPSCGWIIQSFHVYIAFMALNFTFELLQPFINALQRYGIFRVYVDQSANMELANQIVLDAKTNYPAAWMKEEGLPMEESELDQLEDNKEEGIAIYRN